MGSESPEDPLDPSYEAAIDAILDSGGPLPENMARDRNLRVLAAIAAVQRRPLSQSLLQEQDHPAPATIDSLTLIARVGSGAFGDVFRAYDDRLHRDVALKVLSVSRDTDSVLSEGRLLARVRHPNVVTVYGVKRLPDGIALEMEFVNGETLAELVRASGPVPALDVVNLGLVLCDALSAVHAAGLLHRDIKAQNIMRERDTGRIVLMDFGSGLLRGDTHRTHPDLTGTPLYTAPELWEGAAPSARSDVYSLGVLLFFLLSASFPVVASGVDALKARHRERRYRSLLECNRHVPSALASVVQRAVAPDPNSRYDGPDSLADALRNALDGMRRRDSRRVRTALTTALLALTAGGVFVADRAHAARNARETLFVKIPPNNLGASASVDGRIWPFATAEGTLRLFDVSTGRTAAITAKPDDGVVQSAIVSPGADRVAYTVLAKDGAYRLETSGLDGSLARVIIPSESSFKPEPVSWSRDEGLLLCWLHQRNGSLDLAAVPASGEPPRILLTRSSREEPGGSLSPDGRFAVLENWLDAETPATELLVVPTDGSATTSLYSDARHPHAPLWSPDNEHVFFLMDSPASSGAQDGWVLTVRDGRRVSAASLVAANLGTGPQINFALTNQQELVSRIFRNTSEVYLHSIDSNITGSGMPPNRIARNAMDRHAGASYSPDGRSIAYFDLGDAPSVGANLRPVLSIMDRSTRHTRSIPLPLTYVGYVRPRWTHDSAGLSAFGRAPGAARFGYYHVDLQARTTTPIVLLDNWAGAHAGQWGADDNHFIYPDPARGLVQRDLTTGHDTVLLGPDSWQSGWFAVGPGGSIAFVLRDSDRHSIAVREPDGLTRRILTAAPGDILDVHAWSADGQYIFFASTRGEATGSIYRVPAVGGVAVDMHIRWAPNPNPAAVSPDGRELAVTEVSVEHELRFLPLYFPN